MYLHTQVCVTCNVTSMWGSGPEGRLEPTAVTSHVKICPSFRGLQFLVCHWHTWTLNPVIPNLYWRFGGGVIKQHLSRILWIYTGSHVKGTCLLTAGLAFRRKYSRFGWWIGATGLHLWGVYTFYLRDLHRLCSVRTNDCWLRCKAL